MRFQYYSQSASLHTTLTLLLGQHTSNRKRSRYPTTVRYLNDPKTEQCQKEEVKGIFGISGKDILNLHNLKKYNRLKTACYKYFKSKARY